MGDLWFSGLGSPWAWFTHHLQNYLHTICKKYLHTNNIYTPTTNSPARGATGRSGWPGRRCCCYRSMITLYWIPFVNLFTEKWMVGTFVFQRFCRLCKNSAWHKNGSRLHVCAAPDIQSLLKLHVCRSAGTGLCIFTSLTFLRWPRTCNIPLPG